MKDFIIEGNYQRKTLYKDKAGRLSAATGMLLDDTHKWDAEAPPHTRAAEVHAGWVALALD